MCMYVCVVVCNICGAVVCVLSMMYAEMLLVCGLCYIFIYNIFMCKVDEWWGGCIRSHDK